MPRGGHKVKTANAVQTDASAALNIPGVPSMATKLTRTNTDRRTSILSSSFLSRSSTQPNLAVPVPTPIRPAALQCSPAQKVINRDLSIASVHASKISDYDDDCVSQQLPESVPLSRTTSIRSTEGEGEDSYKLVLETFENSSPETSQASSLSSTYSRDSISVNSRASSICSSRTSIYSLDECAPEESDSYVRTRSREASVAEVESLNSRLPGGLQYQQTSRSTSVRRQDTQDAAARERSSLAKKAAMFKNSRLRPQLPRFSTSLLTWSIVCRAAQASEDCYDSALLTRRGVYTPADTSKDIKAMIVDEQTIDSSRLIIVAIRGTQFQSLTDWAVNKAANPVKPTGFLDDVENACHEGFLQVTKAMLGQVASQLKQHATDSDSEKPTLLFTGHSAGGAVAAMLYSHMLSKSVQSDLTALASQFENISCITFGAPPLSQTPLPRQGSGVFLTFANEGDPVLRLTNAAYVKSLAKLMTTSPPASVASAIAPPPVKVVRGSRGTAVYKQTLPAPPPIPWEELPLWPTPPASLTNAGDVVLLRDQESGCASASQVTVEDLKDVIFGDLVQHTMGMYLRRVKDVVLTAMMGRDVY